VAHSGTAPDESAVNSVDYSHRDNSIVTQLLAPGSAVVARLPDPAITVIGHPPDPDNQLTMHPSVTWKAAPAPIDTPATRSDKDQNDSDDTILDSYTPNELGTPYVEPPEIE
jgi:hypothetical protein